MHRAEGIAGGIGGGKIDGQQERHNGQHREHHGNEHRQHPANGHRFGGLCFGRWRWPSWGGGFLLFLFVRHATMIPVRFRDQKGRQPYSALKAAESDSADRQKPGEELEYSRLAF